MAFTTLVGVGGGLSLSLFASPSSSSTSTSFLRAGGDSRKHGLRPFVTPQSGGARGERTKRWNCLALHSANEANVVTEDDTVNDATDDEAASDADTDDTVDTDGDSADELESSSPDDVASVAWIKQQPLPYPLNALEPYMSKETVEQHWGVHQHMHVERLNVMIGGSEWEGMSLGQMMLSSFNEGREPPHAPFFHAAQIRSAADQHSKPSPRRQSLAAATAPCGRACGPPSLLRPPLATRGGAQAGGGGEEKEIRRESTRGSGETEEEDSVLALGLGRRKK